MHTLVHVKYIMQLYVHEYNIIRSYNTLHTAECSKSVTHVDQILMILYLISRSFSGATPST